MSISSLKTGVVSPSSLLVGNTSYNPPPSTVQLLVVGGGARSGTAGSGGGGGGGGANYQATAAVSAGTSYTITVGGAGSNSSAILPTTYTGGAGNFVDAGSGAVPGGASGTPQSYAGGTGTGDGKAGGGGGGAGAVGQNGFVIGVDGRGGNGGNGYTSFDGNHYGAGGAGSGNWSGAGQAGQLSTGGGIRGESPFDAAANSGCGGGARGGGASGSGGSGIVFIKYADTFPAATSTTGSPTITTSGGYRLYKFTGSGTITF